MTASKRKKWLVAGHGGYEILSNLLLALMPALSALYLEYGHLKEMYIRGSLLGSIIIATNFLIMFAYPTYLLYELKHLIDPKQRVGKINRFSIMLFSLEALSGLLLQVYVITIWKEVLIPYTHAPNLTIAVLSILAAYGGCLGVTDLPLLPWPPWVWEHTKVILQSPKLIAVCIGTTVLFYCISNIITAIPRAGF